jgi:hypothetical protein
MRYPSALQSLFTDVLAACGACVEASNRILLGGRKHGALGGGRQKARRHPHGSRYSGHCGATAAIDHTCRFCGGLRTDCKR